MGTSTAFDGQGGHTPLIPSWLDDEVSVENPPDQHDPSDAAESTETPPTASYRPLPPIGDPSRFASARGNFSRFASSGGRDRRSLARAVSQYVSTSAGGSRSAATRMGASRGASSRLVGFLTDAANRGLAAALRALNLDSLAGRPIEDVFIGLADHVCPDGGSIDEGIARSAFIETITELAEAGVTDLDDLSSEQVQSIFEVYATHAIEARICNDIGAHAVSFPEDSNAAAQVQAQLHDFIQRSVADALVAVQTDSIALSLDGVPAFVNDVYQQAFHILEAMGDAEAET